MKEERKQELRQLLEKAKKNLVIRNKYGGPSSFPVAVYRRYLQERWRYHGIDFSSVVFSLEFAPDIANQSTRSNVLHYIREELAPFLEKAANSDFDCIQTANYIVERDSTNGDRIYKCGGGSLPLYMVMERLLEITLVRGIEEAVSLFETCSHPKGTHSYCRDVGLLEGVKLETEVDVFEGVRLLPLPSSKITREVEQHLFRFPVHFFSDRQDSLFGKTLLVIDQPGFSMLLKPSEKAIQSGTQLDNLPFQAEVHKVKFQSVNEVDSFQTLFCNALSLACDSPTNIFVGFHALEAEKSFDPSHGAGSVLRNRNPLGTSTEVKHADIEKAKYLYKRLDGFNPYDREKLTIPIERWQKSKTSGNLVDKMIALRIALEGLYATGKGGKMQQVYSRGARHLGMGMAKESKDQLRTEIKQIYKSLSDAAHQGKLPQTAPLGEKCLPMSEFIARVQDLCRKSILKVLEDGKMPN